MASLFPSLPLPFPSPSSSSSPLDPLGLLGGGGSSGPSLPGLPGLPLPGLPLPGLSPSSGTSSPLPDPLKLMNPFGSDSFSPSNSQQLSSDPLNNNKLFGQTVAKANNSKAGIGQRTGYDPTGLGL